MGAGGAIGGTTGALIGLGIPEYQAKRYEGRMRKGGILLSVHDHPSVSHRLLHLDRWRGPPRAADRRIPREETEAARAARQAEAQLAVIHRTWFPHIPAGAGASLTFQRRF
jgi:hypothetical protein